jgi:hypothetical protein
MALFTSVLDRPPSRRYAEDSFVNLLTDFQGSPGGKDGDDPQAFLVEMTAEDNGVSEIGAHFHRVDQYQLFIGGGGRVGSHVIAPEIVTIHYADAYAPYGPIVGTPTGINFMTIRMRPDPDGGGHFLRDPASLEVRKGKGGRTVSVDVHRTEMPDTSVVEALHGPSEDGLAIHRITAPAGAVINGPTPAGGGGQYLVVIGGSLRHNGQDHPTWSLVVVQPGEEAATLEAGAEGLDLVVLGFPRPDHELHDATS